MEFETSAVGDAFGVEDPMDSTVAPHLGTLQVGTVGKRLRCRNPRARRFDRIPIAVPHIPRRGPMLDRDPFHEIVRPRKDCSNTAEDWSLLRVTRHSDPARSILFVP